MGPARSPDRAGPAVAARGVSALPWQEAGPSRAPGRTARARGCVRAVPEAKSYGVTIGKALSGSEV